MKRKSRLSLSGYISFFVLVAVIITVACLVSSVLTANIKSKGVIAAIMLAVVITLAAVCTVCDLIRRKFMVDRPVDEILSATDKIANGNFDIQLKPFHSYAKFDAYDLIMENINKMAKELSQNEVLKTDFISNVSHEIKTPLAVISNQATLLQDKNLTEKERAECVNSLLSATNRLTGLVTNILKLNRLENQVISEQKTETHLGNALGEIILGFEEILDRRSLELSCDIDDVVCLADRTFFEIICNNLLSNAIKFTPDAGEIDISSKVVNARELQYDHCFEDDIKKLQGNYLLVCVEDHGIGIERKDLNHVFDKFAQIENSLSRKVGGSGLGLPIARQLMESHNGAIWCDSEINKGSKFYFVIPIANDKSNFVMIKKQLAQKARSNGSTIAVIRIKSTNEVIENLLRENNLLNKTYMTNSLIEKEGAMTTLSLILMDGDKPSAEFLKKKIDSVVEEKQNLYGKCDIMYSYDIEGDTHEKDSYSG